MYGLMVNGQCYCVCTSLNMFLSVYAWYEECMIQYRIPDDIISQYT